MITYYYVYKDTSMINKELYKHGNYVARSAISTI